MLFLDFMFQRGIVKRESPRKRDDFTTLLLLFIAKLNYFKCAEGSQKQMKIESVFILVNRLNFAFLCQPPWLAHFVVC